jgi:hypothetical protein
MMGICRYPPRDTVEEAVTDLIGPEKIPGCSQEIGSRKVISDIHISTIII